MNYSIGQRVENKHTGERGTVIGIQAENVQRITVRPDAGGTHSYPVHFRMFTPIACRELHSITVTCRDCGPKEA